MQDIYLIINDFLYNFSYKMSLENNILFAKAS